MILKLTKNSKHLVLVFSIILISRVLNLVAFQEPSFHPDSSGYSSGNFLDFSLVSLTGDAIRSWPAPLLFALMPSHIAKIIIQMLISIIGWTYLSYVLIEVFKTQKIKNLFVIILVIFSTNPILLQWETTLLGQSLLVSNVIFLVAFSIQLKFHFSKYLAFLSIMGTGLLFLQKSSNIFLSLFFFLYFINIILRSTTKKFVIKIISLFMILFIYSTWVNINVNNYWGSISYSGYASLYHLGAQSPEAEGITQFLANEPRVPKCILQNSPYLDVGKSVKEISLHCPESHKYISQELKIDLIKYYLSSPSSLFRLISIGFGASFTSAAAHYGKVLGIFPNTVYELFNGTTSPDFLKLGTDNQVEALKQVDDGEPIWIYSPGLLLIITSLLLFFYRWYERNDLKYDSIFIVLIFIFLSNSALNFVLVPSEWVRLSMPNITVSILLSLAYIFYVFEKNEREFKVARLKSNL